MLPSEGSDNLHSDCPTRVLPVWAVVLGPIPLDQLDDCPAHCLARFPRVGKKRIAWAQTGLCGLFGVGDPGPGLPEPPSPVTRDPNPWSGHTKHDTRNADNSRHGVSGSRPNPPLPGSSRSGLWYLVPPPLIRPMTSRRTAWPGSRGSERNESPKPKLGCVGCSESATLDQAYRSPRHP